MPLIVDTDAFTKLAPGGLLQLAVAALGVQWSDCARLPALCSMLQRGRLYNRLGPATCGAILPIAQQLAIAPAASPAWLDQLTGIPNIDPGEAQLLARAAEAGEYLLTADKRALMGVKSVNGFAQALHQRVVIVEAILLRLCTLRGESFVRQAIQPVIHLDTMFATCFSVGNNSPASALKSYYDAAARDLAPLTIWSP